MKQLLSPVIALTNAVRFKTKFLILAAMFYLPLFVTSSWIILEQQQLLTQYHDELEGFYLIEEVLKIESNVASVRSSSVSTSALTLQLEQLTQNISSSELFKQLTPQANQLAKQWQDVSDQLSAESFDTFQSFYTKTLALRENIAALSGLTRESDANAFYLLQIGEDRLPNLVEYLKRFQDLTSLVVSNGYNAERYTVIVAQLNRLQEFNLQLGKSVEQLERIAEGELSDYLNTGQALVADVEQYLNTINTQVIQPENIALTQSRSTALAKSISDKAFAFKQLTNEKLIEQIELLQGASRSNLWLVSIIIVLVILATSYLLLGIYWSLRNNVQLIKDAAEQLGNGDFSQQLAIRANDELGDIGQSFSLMQSKVNQLLVLLQSDVIDLKTASENIHQLTNSMQTNIASQQQETHHVAEAVSQVTVSVNSIAENTEDAKKVTDTASGYVQQGQTIVIDTAQAITDISKEVNQSAQVINELANNSTNIGRFVDVIREIAEQTNLLALNAAIEAARAGEQGRGFAVVADEVRTLASRTQDATAEIQRIISALQEGAEHAVVAMNQGVDKADLGVEKTQLVQQSFTAVTQSVQDIVHATLGISSAITQQREMVLSIDENTNNIARGSDNVLSAADEAALAGERLSLLADNLSSQLAQFKLGK